MSHTTQAIVHVHVDVAVLWGSLQRVVKVVRWTATAARSELAINRKSHGAALCEWTCPTKNKRIWHVAVASRGCHWSLLLDCVSTRHRHQKCEGGGGAAKRTFNVAPKAMLVTHASPQNWFHALVLSGWMATRQDTTQAPLTWPPVRLCAA